MSLDLRLLLAFAALFSITASGSVVESSDPGQQLARSAAVFRGTVLRVQSYQVTPDAPVYTAAYIRVDETFKGNVPAVVKLVHRGGTVPGGGESDGFAPEFTPGEERLLFVARASNGSLFARLGNASALRLWFNGQETFGTSVLKELRSLAAGVLPGDDVTDQAATAAELSAGPGIALGPPPPSFAPHSDATNLMVGTDLIPARFIVPDRAEPIPYYIDADFLPSGISLEQATNAVASALAAWTNVTSLRFKFSGLQSFGMAAPNVQIRDGAMRIQLHDAYGFIPGTGTILGQGGRSWSVRNLSSDWTLGGNVQGNDFHQVTKGYVVRKHTAGFLQNPSNLAEVLCHEIGHAIGVAHSSENANEPNPVLNEALMYYRAHGNGRGAVLSAFDINTCLQIYPKLNTPPFTFDRVIEVVTTPNPQSFSVPGVNSVLAPAYDLQAGPLSVAIADPSAPNGTFSLAADTITYVPAGFLSEATGEFDFVYTRCSDGVNASPYAVVRVVAFRPDDHSEGVPNSWRLSWFGSEDPGPGAHADDDPDGDGVSNVVEFLLGSDPTDQSSNLRITSFFPGTLEWQAKPRELYEVHSSSNLVDWARAATPLIATNSPASISDLPRASAHEFFRVRRVP